MSLHVDPFHQWQFLYSRCNWYDFTLLNVGGEWDHMFGNFEITVAVLGLGVRVTWHYKDTEKGREIAQRIADFDAR